MQRVPDLAQITSLFDRFNSLQRFDQASCRQFLRDVQGHVDRLHAKQVSKKLRETPDFNIFEITNRAHYEVTTHSAFLAHLFDPLGNHGQGNLFLSSFLKLLKQKLPPQWVCAPADHRWHIVREENRIDITLDHPDPPCCIIIENKWDRGDTKDQLLGYWRHKHAEYGRNISLVPSIYLTKEGRPPTFSRADSLPKEFDQGIVPISYSIDIDGLLRPLLDQIKSVRVRATMEQYLDILARSS